MAQKFYAIITTLIVALFASCGEVDHFEQAAKAPTPTEERTPVYVDITVDGDTVLLDEDGNRVTPRPERVTIAMKAMPDTAKAAGADPWALHETEANPKTPAYEGLGGSTQWAYNYSNVAVEYSVYALYKGRKLPLWKPERLRMRQEHLRTESDGSTYSVSDVHYSLSLGTQVLATAPQVLCTEVGYVDQFLGVRVLRQTHQVGSGVFDSTTGILTCLDSLFVAELWTSGYKNEQALLVHMQNHISVATSGQVVADLSKTVGKSWTGNSANLGGFVITETWISKNTRESKLEATMNGQTYNFIDSVHVCKWIPNGGKVETAKKVRLDFAREGEPTDRCNSYLDVNIEQNEVKEVKFLEAKHILFPKEAGVNTTSKTINVDHKDRAWFLLTYKNGTTGKDSVNYDVNHLFTYSVVDYIPADLKGKTVDIDAKGNVYYNGKVTLTITLKSRTVKNLTYRGKDYTSSAAKCDLTPKKAFFGENTITVTFTHDSENVTGKLPVTYNGVKGYKVVGSPVHLSWNNVTGTYQLTCNNKVIVVEVLQDDSEGQTFELPYISYNYWVVSGMIGGEVTQEQLDGIINQAFAIDANGKVTILGSTMILSHSMKADKVTKGSWSYQPSPCEAVATYLTPISAKQGRVDIYHDGKKVDEFLVDLNFTIKVVPDTPFDGVILCGSTTDHYADHVSSLTGTDDHVLTKVADGDYRHYWRSMGSKNWQSESLGSIGNLTGKNLAWWYETDKSTRHLGAVEAYEREGESDRWLLIYKDMNGTVQYHLGKAEETINAPFRYPVQRTLKEVVKEGRTLWTFDNVEFFTSK